MKTVLLKKILNYFLFFGLVFFIAMDGNAQDLKTTHDDAPQKGHALYKKTKIYDSKTGPVGAKPKAVGDRAMDRWLYEVGQTQDPYTRKIPENIKAMELEFSGKIAPGSLKQEALKQFSGKNNSRRNFSFWKPRGPSNVGGRTRALLIDLQNENNILAGGVSGGLWRSTNTGETWRRVTRNQQSPNITAIVQDPRPRNQHIMYYASGERFGNSASAGGAFYQGTGLYKSYNSGRNWNIIRGSNDNDVTSFSSFDLINSLAVDPRNGDLYVATFDGVFRSQNGGRDFNEVLSSGFDRTTEVMITPSGKIYATVDVRSTTNPGFYVSDDGTNFTEITPPGIVPAFGRTIMAADPSDENRIFFFSSDLSGSVPAFLWRYQADAETPEERWVDLSTNLPINIGGPIGSLDLQGSYNMVVKVHPTQPDIVFIGGTNLYRSTTGFTTPTGVEGWIAGYNILNDVSLYPNHHPDQHNLAFFPSNPNRALSANDGGVQITEDITRITPDLAVEDVDWTSLNNGYITTQPYVISIDPEGGNDDVLAGFQDNGTWFTNSVDVNAPWTEEFSGDGSFNAIADGGRTRYVSAQRGVVFRFNLDENGDFVSFTRVQPAGATGFGFIAPFILDPNNDNIMYMPAGDRIWRNNDLDEIPLFSNALTSVNWVEQTQTATPDGSTITALGVSKFPVANTLYYGTNSGGIFKVENANLDNQEVVDIFTGKGLPPGNVNNFYVDPFDSDRVFVVFSNYNIPSLFVTNNGGETWTNISGNLEENPDGTGNGPSVRSFAVSGGNNIFFAGTSTGLFITHFLNGENTSWYRESGVIGDRVVTDIKTREDGFVALATHGNGIYDAAFYAAPQPAPTLSVTRLLDDIIVPTNSGDFQVDIADLFASSGGQSIQLELTNSNSNLVTATLNGDIITVSIAPETNGSATIGIIATAGNERVAEGFTVNVVEPAIYEQVDPVVGSRPSQFFTDFGGLAQSADDFIIPEGTQWSIRNILAFGVANGSPALTDATVVIYTNNNGVPGDEIYNSGTIIPISESNDTNLNLDLPEEITLNSGSYWLSVYTNLAFNPGVNQQWFWSTQSGGIGNENRFRDLLNLFGTGAVDWTPASLVFGGAPADQVFQIFGTSEDVSNETVEETVTSTLADDDLENLATIDTDVITTAWPNPSTSAFFFSLQDTIYEKVNAKVFNFLGQLVHEESGLDSNQPISWDASNSPAGIYMVKITGPNTNKSFKIVKR